MNKKKTGTVAAVICFVAAIAIAGTYTFNDYKQSKYEQELAKAEETQLAKEEKEKAEQTTTDLIINTQEDTANAADTSNVAQESSDTLGTAEDAASDSAIASAGEAVSSSSKSVSFSSDSQMLWPVSGNVLMNYSMDKTVYFKTLDQYKYNPALIIAGAVGDQVIAGAPGVVKSIDNTAKTGTTVNVDMGNGYEAFYGQLKEVPVKVGDNVDAKTVIGYVAEPTKYYSVEGSNVYFEMRKDGRPVNPMEYLLRT